MNGIADVVRLEGQLEALRSALPDLRRLSLDHPHFEASGKSRPPKYSKFAK
jgi:hypothetical protein